MNITTSASAALRTAPSAAVTDAAVVLGAISNENTEPSTEAPTDTFKTNITRAAYASGGALSGLALGAVGGKLMSHLSGNDVFATYGGVAGAVGGAATTLALSLSDQPISIGRTFGSWAGASAGSAAGMGLVGSLGKLMAANSGAAYMGAHGGVIGAVAGGLIGAGAAFAGAEGKFARAAVSTAKVAAGATIGLLVGGGAQSLLNQNAGHLAAMGAAFPAVSTVALAAVGLNSAVNPGWMNDEKPVSAGMERSMETILGGTAGYAVGALVGGIAHSVSGVAAYSMLAPALGAAVGGGLVLGETSSNADSPITKAAVTLGAGSAGLLLGDAIGHGLSALTGQPAFAALGPAVGAINGATLGLHAVGNAGHYALPTIGAVSAGTAVGAVLGSVLSNFTGFPAYQVIGTAVGATAGLFTGLSAGANKASAARGAVAGVVAGLAGGVDFEAMAQKEAAEKAAVLSAKAKKEATA